MTRHYEGAGIGLAIASRLTHPMGGQITVQSEPGSGSRFTVSLPLSSANLVA
ncbi:MAG: ATP-binding protein [Caldilineaceae bacterium]